MPPLLLLDEVDAHLDQDNIALLVKFIKNWKGEQAGTENVRPQVLMISHQEEALSQCDSLIGVTQQEFLKSQNAHESKAKDDDKKDLNVFQKVNPDKCISAITFSMDLRKFVN